MAGAAFGTAITEAGPVNGVVVDLWRTSRFGGLPHEGDPTPGGGSPDYGPVLSGTTFGSPGAWSISSVDTDDYYVRWISGGVNYWTGPLQVRQAGWIGLVPAGGPPTGTHHPGDAGADSAGLIWRCTATGTPGTWKVLANTLVYNYSVNNTTYATAVPVTAIAIDPIITPTYPYTMSVKVLGYIRNSVEDNVSMVIYNHGRSVNITQPPGGSNWIETVGFVRYNGASAIGQGIYGAGVPAGFWLDVWSASGNVLYLELGIEVTITPF